MGIACSTTGQPYFFFARFALPERLPPSRRAEAAVLRALRFRRAPARNRHFRRVRPLPRSFNRPPAARLLRRQSPFPFQVRPPSAARSSLHSGTTATPPAGLIRTRRRRDGRKSIPTRHIRITRTKSSRMSLPAAKQTHMYSRRRTRSANTCGWRRTFPMRPASISTRSVTCPAPRSPRRA